MNKIEKFEQATRVAFTENTDPAEMQAAAQKVLDGYIGDVTLQTRIDCTTRKEERVHKVTNALVGARDALHGLKSLLAAEQPVCNNIVSQLEYAVRKIDSQRLMWK